MILRIHLGYPPLFKAIVISQRVFVSWFLMYIYATSLFIEVIKENIMSFVFRRKEDKKILFDQPKSLFESI